MNLLSWNVQGMGSPGIFTTLWNLIEIFHPQILFLTETKSDSAKTSRFKDWLNFENMFCVDKEGKSGGLALFWKDYGSNYLIIFKVLYRHYC